MLRLEARFTLTPEEYQAAVMDYLVRNKLLPEGIDVCTVRVITTLAGYEIRPEVTYKKTIIKLYSKTF